MLLPATLVFGGLVLLAFGGEMLVRGAAGLADRLGLSELLIGLTVVGIGTSMPELVASIDAARQNAAGLAVGNIVGSNTANMLLVLGLGALVAPLPLRSSALRRDALVAIAAGIGFGVLGAVWGLGRVPGAIMLVLLAVYVGIAYRQERNAPATEAEVEALVGKMATPRRRSGVMLLLLAVGGLVTITIGARVTVDNAIVLARLWGVSESVIGLSLVAVGTSLPEVVTSIVAAYRRRPEVALGNALGSCIYNTLGIGGVLGILTPLRIPDAIVRIDLPIMVVATILPSAFTWTRARISRVEGAVLVTLYLAYMGWLWGQA